MSKLAQLKNIPNFITLGRIVLIPVFVTALIYQRYDLALLFFSLAAVSDLLDGYLARRLNQGTDLGSFLDPMADKVLLLTSFILLSVFGWIPLWLTITIISRDLIVVMGWFMLYFTGSTTRVAPSMAGKIAIASQLILVAYVLLAINVPSIPDESPLAGDIIVAVFTVYSGLQYMYRALISNGK